GDGNDTVTVAGYSNSLSDNLTKIAAGLGNDTITFTGNGANAARLDGGDGGDKLKIDGLATGSLVGGTGSDVLVDYAAGTVTLTGGSGGDPFAFDKGVHATITDFVAGSDHVTLIGVTAAQVHVTHPGVDTLLDLGGVGSVRLTGVHLSTAQLDLHFG